MYLVGVVFYRLRSHLRIKASWIFAACGSLIVAAIVPHGWPLVFPVAGAYLLLVAAFHPAIHLHGWSRFGDSSYGTYLYGFPVQQMIMHSIGHLVSPWRLFCPRPTPLTLSCAVVSWHVVERWFLHSVRRKTFEPRTVETEQIHCLVNGSRKLPLTKAFQLIEYKTCRALASEVPLTKERMLTSLGQISRGKGSSILQGPSRLALTGKVSGLARSVRRSSNWRIRH